MSSGPPTPVCLVGTRPPDPVPHLSLGSALQELTEEYHRNNYNDDSDATESEPEPERPQSRRIGQVDEEADYEGGSYKPAFRSPSPKNNESYKRDRSATPMDVDVDVDGADNRNWSKQGNGHGPVPEEEDDNRTVTDPGPESDMEIVREEEERVAEETETDTSPPSPMRDMTTEPEEQHVPSTAIEINSGGKDVRMEHDEHDTYALPEINDQEEDVDMEQEDQGHAPHEKSRSPSPARSPSEERSQSSPEPSGERARSLGPSDVAQDYERKNHAPGLRSVSRTRSPSPFNPPIEQDTQASTALPFSPTPSTPPELPGAAATTTMANTAVRKEKPKKPRSSATAVPKKKGLAKIVTKKKKPTVLTVSVSDDESASVVEAPSPIVPSVSSSAILASVPSRRPNLHKKKKRKESKNGDDPLYCICRKPDTGKWMIQCDACEEWFHGDCVKVREEDEPLIDKYFCASCYDPPTSVTTWKRKCRLPSCREPAAVDLSTPTPQLSKYCSPAHGIEFFNLQLSRATHSRAEIAALVAATRNVTEFKQLGDRIPTPPPETMPAGATASDGHDMPFSAEEIASLEEIAAERVALENKRRNLEAKQRYLEFALARKKRVFEELKAEGENVGKDICGYDERFAMDDDVWEEWVENHLNKEVNDDGEEHIKDEELRTGRDGVCVKKRCVRHAKWQELVGDDLKAMEQLRVKRAAELGEEERKIRERRKRLWVKDPREGIVEVEG